MLDEFGVQNTSTKDRVEWGVSWLLLGSCSRTQTRWVGGLGGILSGKVLSML
ncbi:hypothetical protein HYC85_013101 [Camellia sinensis]|uniref:Uncharacterized protein n=1 Tax=Camellia sinensis TaxID=4442 RepID=A0A7J7HGL6_CAMSI|nr:hypothetical protein HYC85_013101 [Camellia sinensis]